MTWETRLQNTDSKLGMYEEDSTKIADIDFKKVGHLDISIPCSICHQEVHLRQLFYHKKAHQAQAVLTYERPWVETIDLTKIVLQRRQLISRMLHTGTYTEREIGKLRYAFEFLEENLKAAPYFHIKRVAQSTVRVEEVSNTLIKAIAICQDRNALWRTDLEDVFVVLDNYGNRTGTCFLGLFDGSNGISAAGTTAIDLPLLLLDQLSKGDPSYQMSEAEQQILNSFRTVFRADYRAKERAFSMKRSKAKASLPNEYEWLHKAYAKSFWRMDRLLRLGRNEVSKVCWSSCTAATCLLEEVNSEKQNQQVGEEMPKEANKKVTDFMQQEELAVRINTATENSMAEPKEAAPLKENRDSGKEQQQQQEPHQRVKDDKEKRVMQLEGKELLADKEVTIQEENLLETSHSSGQSDKNSVGIMHIANIGNVHAVLCKDGKSYWLTKEHTTYCANERIRILQNGGYISTNEPKGLIEGLLSTTRSLGYHGNPKLKKTVIPVPHTISLPVDSSCQFLILASHGLWEVLDKNEVVALTLSMFSAYLEKYKHAQLKKSCKHQDSKLTLKDEFYSWYLDQETFDTDLADNNLEHNSPTIRPPSISSENKCAQSVPFRHNSKKPKLENHSEETTEFSNDISFSNDTGWSSFDSQDISEETEDLEETEEQVSGSTLESSSITSEDEETNSRTFYAHAAKYISKRLVKAALIAGSRDNITVLVALLNGCDKIPTYL